MFQARKQSKSQGVTAVARGVLPAPCVSDTDVVTTNVSGLDPSNMSDAERTRRLKGLYSPAAKARRQIRAPPMNPPLNPGETQPKQSQPNHVVHQQAMMNRHPFVNPFEPAPLTTIIKQEEVLDSEVVATEGESAIGPNVSAGASRSSFITFDAHAKTEQNALEQRKELQERQSEDPFEPTPLKTLLERDQQWAKANEQEAFKRPPMKQDPPMDSLSQERKERFLMFARVLMKYLEQKDPAVHLKAKAIIRECGEKNKKKVPGYEVVAISMQKRLRDTVGEAYWNRAEAYLNHFLKQKEKKGNGPRGTRRPLASGKSTTKKTPMWTAAKGRSTPAVTSKKLGEDQNKRKIEEEPTSQKQQKNVTTKIAKQNLPSQLEPTSQSRSTPRLPHPVWTPQLLPPLPLPLPLPPLPLLPPLPPYLQTMALEQQHHAYCYAQALQQHHHAYWYVKDRQRQHQAHSYLQAHHTAASSRVDPIHCLGKDIQVQQQEQRANLYAQAQQQPQAIQVAGNSSVDLFFRLGEDVHRHILSYLMCPSEGRIARPRNPKELYIEAHRNRVSRGRPHFDSDAVTRVLANEFCMLSEPRKGKWKRRAERERVSHFMQESDPAFVTPSRLLSTCTNVVLVSKYWLNVGGDMMNLQAPSEIISPRALFTLKCRALTLSLSPVCNEFGAEIQRRWGDESLDGTDKSVFDILAHRFGGSASFANLVAAEYAKFLVVKSVECITSSKCNVHEAPSFQAWKEPCVPNELIHAFWVAHMLDPRKYARDCYFLVRDMLDGSGECPFNCIFEHNSTAGSSNKSTIPKDAPAESNYQSKRDLLFQFEKQLPRTDAFIGRFGDHDTNTAALFSETFDIHKAACKILEYPEGYSG